MGRWDLAGYGYVVVPGFTSLGSPASGLHALLVCTSHVEIKNVRDHKAPALPSRRDVWPRFIQQYDLANGTSVLGVGEGAIVSFIAHPATPFYVIASYHIRVANDGLRLKLATELGPYAPLLFAPATLVGDEQGAFFLASPSQFGPAEAQTFAPARRASLINLYSKGGAMDGLRDSIFTLMGNRPMAAYDMLPTEWQPATLAMSLQQPFSASSQDPGASSSQDPVGVLTLRQVPSSAIDIGSHGVPQEGRQEELDVESLLSQILEPAGAGLLDAEAVFKAEVQKAQRPTAEASAKLLVKNASGLAEKYLVQINLHRDAAKKKKSSRALGAELLSIRKLKEAGSEAFNRARGWWPEPSATALLTP